MTLGPHPDVTAETLLRAYMMGIFPMAESRDDPTMHWVDPRLRGILPLDGFHISQSLAKRIRKGGYAVRTDTAFADVVTACADRPETWINARIYDLYLQLHDAGHAHSIEIWDKTLIGGVYGVTIGGAFFGESMFSRRTDASKLALFHTIRRLDAGGFTLFDTQFLTPHLASLGGIEIKRHDYHKRLNAALRVQATFTPPGYSDAGSSTTG